MTPDLVLYRKVATIGAIGLILAQLPFVWNLIRSYRHGAVAGPNPWHANSLEWAVPSPPPHGNFAAPPVVYRGPYEFSVPTRAQDFWPQHQEG